MNGVNRAVGLAVMRDTNLTYGNGKTLQELRPGKTVAHLKHREGPSDFVPCLIRKSMDYFPGISKENKLFSRRPHPSPSYALTVSSLQGSIIDRPEPEGPGRHFSVLRYVFSRQELSDTR